MGADPADPAEIGLVGRVGLVGVGRAGSALGAALAAAGCPVVAVHARSIASAGRAARIFPTARRLGTAGAVARAADVVLLAVPDDALPALALELAVHLAAEPTAELAADLAADLATDLAAERVPAPASERAPDRPTDLASAPALDRGARPVVVQLSGRHGLAVLAPLRDRLGLPRAAIHPIMTLAGTDHDADLLRGASFGITADPDAAALARTLVLAVGGRPVAVPEDGRAAYHAALTLSANFGATLAAAAADLLRRAGVSEPAAAVGPLLRQSLAGVLAGGEAALTGPVRRGDAGTVRAHLAAMAAAGLPESALAAYRAVGRLTADRLVSAGVVDEASLAGVVAALAEPS